MRRKQGSIINMSNKGINKQNEDMEPLKRVKSGLRTVRHEHSQDETTEICRVNLPMADYGQLQQLALRQGCTPEELVAQQIERIIRRGIR